MAQDTTTTAVVTGGLDVSDRYSYVSVLNAGGEVVDEGRVPTTPEGLRRRFSGLARMRLVLETGTPSPWVSRFFEKSGDEGLLGHARRGRLHAASDAHRGPRGW